MKNTNEFDPNKDLTPIHIVNIGGIYQHYKGTKYKGLILLYTQRQKKNWYCIVSALEILFGLDQYLVFVV